MQLRHLLMASALLYGAQAQAQPATASRLIATATSQHNSAVFVLRDSSYMTYTNDRGGDLEHTMKFDKKTDMLFNANTTNYNNSARTTQTYDANSNILTSLAESYNLPSSSWTNVSNTLNTYENNNLSTQTMQYWNSTTQSWSNSSKTLYFYNGDATPDTIITQFWDFSGSNWINSSMMINNYDVDGNVLIETYFVWDGSSSWNNSFRNIYSYTGKVLDAEMSQTWNGSLNAWVNSARNLYTYDGNGNMLTNVNSYWNTSTNVWMNSSKTTNVFSMRNDMESRLLQFWNVAQNNWLNSEMNTYSYDTMHNNTIDVYMTWNTGNNSFRNINRQKKTYNSRMQLATQTSDQWNVGGFWEMRNGDLFNRYHYQTYTLGIANVQATGVSELEMYPVPASNVMNISAVWEKPQDFTVTISDLTGKVVRQWNEPATGNYRKSIPVTNMAAGNYFIRLRGTETQTVKQFVVTH